VKKFNYPKGRFGEEIAERFLVRKGLRIVEKNWRSRFGEVDLICAEGDTLVFVEVKMKVGEEFGTPEEMVDGRKLWQVRRIAELYLLNNPEVSGKYPRQRIDVVAIVTGQDGGEERISHYENIEL